MIIAEIVLAFIGFYLDPLGLTAQKNRALEDIAAVFSQQIHETSATEKLAVVLIDEGTLRSWGEDWPIPYGKTAKIIRALACARTVGVFFDYTASRQISLAADEELLEAEVTDSSMGIAHDCPDNLRPTKIRVSFGLVDGIETRLARALRASHAAFWLDAGPNDNLYPAGRTTFPDRAAGSDRSPAFGILADMPSLWPLIPRDSEPLCDENDLRVQCWTNPLRLAWNAKVDPKQKEVSDLSRCRGSIGLLQTVLNVTGLAVHDRYETCPPILTLTGEDLFRDATFIERNGDPLKELKGRFVLVGTRLGGLNDQVYSPLHGYLPGVYKHAMALENLIMDGAGYRTIPKPWVLNVIVLLIYAVIEIVRETTGRSPHRDWFVLAAVCATLGMFAAIVGYCHWPWSLLPAVFLYYGGAFMFLRFVTPSRMERES